MVSFGAYIIIYLFGLLELRNDSTDWSHSKSLRQISRCSYGLVSPKPNFLPVVSRARLGSVGVLIYMGGLIKVKNAGSHKVPS